MRPAPDRLNDFYQDWGSAGNPLVGLPIYTYHATSTPRHLGLPSNPVPSIEYNAHPLTSVLLVLLLAWLDYPNAVLVWNMISVAALAVSLRIVASELALPRMMLPPTLTLLAFCHPVYGNFYQGQLTLILALNAYHDYLTVVLPGQAKFRSWGASLHCGIPRSGRKKIVNLF